MLLAYALLLLLRCFPAEAERKLNALRFSSESEPDLSYIQWPLYRNSAVTQLTVCSWIRKRFNGPEPTVLSYKEDEFWDARTLEGRNVSAGTDPFHLRIDFNVSDGKWFHACWTWSARSQRITVYVNGEKIRSEHSKLDELSTRGTVCLGNTASSQKDSKFIFGSDLFKLNMFDWVLSHSDIRRMASDLCSTKEEELSAVRVFILKWGEIIHKTRTGKITEISTGCNVGEAEQLIKTHEKLKSVEKKLQETKWELEDTKERLKFYQELENANLTDQAELEKSEEGMYLTLAVIFGSLSAILFILLITLRLR